MVARAWALFAAHLEDVELLTGYEGEDFGATGDPATDRAAAAAVHPLREAQARALVARSGGDLPSSSSSWRTAGWRA